MTTTVQEIPALERGRALVHLALQQRLLAVASEFQILEKELAEFIERCETAEVVAPFFDPTLYVRNLEVGDPLGSAKELATRARALAAALPRTCRTCGCTVENACAGGCSWVAPGLCSQCRPGAVR